MALGDDDKTKHNSGLMGLLHAPAHGQKMSLASLFNRPEVSGLYFSGKTVVLDGYKFIGCRFDNCNLKVSTTNFELIRCVIDASTTITYDTAIAKIIQLFNSRYPWAYQHFSEFVPTQNEDGSITITDRPV